MRITGDNSPRSANFGHPSDEQQISFAQDDTLLGIGHIEVGYIAINPEPGQDDGVAADIYSSEQSAMQLLVSLVWIFLRLFCLNPVASRE